MELSRHEKPCDFITVVIPTFNSEKSLPYVLDALTRIDYDKKKIKIVIVDDNSTDNTYGIALEFKQRYDDLFYQVEVIRLDERVTTSKARNEGIKRAVPSSCIFLLDSDVVPNTSTLKELIELFRDPRVGAVGKLCLTDKPSLFEKMMWFRYLGQIKEGPAGTGALLLKPEVIRKVGLLNEKLGYPKTIYEDLEYVMRIRRAGYKVLIDGRNPLLHYKPLQTLTFSSKSNILTSLKQTIKHFSTYLTFSRAYALYEVLKAAPLRYRLEYVTYAFMMLAMILTLFTNTAMTVLLVSTTITISILYAIFEYRNLDIKTRILAGIAVLISRLLRALALLVHLPVLMIKNIKINKNNTKKQ